MEAEAVALPKGSRFEDRYEILGELGSGSFGRVYQARQLSTGQSVAIKVLSPREGAEEPTGREAERFRREARICAALAHTNVVPLIDSGETEGRRSARRALSTPRVGTCAGGRSTPGGVAGQSREVTIEWTRR